MKKQILTKQDIQRDLLALLNKRKVVTAWLTFCLNISIFFYIVYAVLYASGVYLPPRHLSFVSPTAVMIIVPFVILFFAGFLFFYYYSKLYEIKKGKFRIIQEKLFQKEREIKSYYHHVEKENALYFRYGRIAVDEKIYLSSNIGDSFYLIILKSSKVPLVIYPMKSYEINNVL